jgi:hypothetical protein
MENEYLKLFNTNELNRLQRCAKNKDKKEIIKWGQEFEAMLNKKFYDIYKKQYMIWLEETFKDLDTALMYTLHFNEYTKFGNKRLKSVMDDLAITLKGFYKGEFERKDYNKMLTDDGINIVEAKIDR